MIDITIYLPLQYNDGKPIEKEKFDQTYSEILEKFGGYSLYENVKGSWTHIIEGKIYHDISNVIKVITRDTLETREWVKSYKEILKVRFRQLEILITITKIEIL